MNNNDTNDVTILDIINNFLHFKLFIFVSIIISSILSLSFTFFIITPQYRSNADVMVQIEQSSGSNETNFDYANAFRLIDTVAELMTKEVVYNLANDKLVDDGFESISHSYFLEGININASSTSFFIVVSFIDPNPDYAQSVVNAVIDSVIEITDLQEAFPVLTNKIKRASFATSAVYYSPNRIISFIVGPIIGFLFSISYLTIIDLFSNSFRSKEEIEKVLNIQVIGVIPSIDVKGLKLHGNKK
jgi:capsular polysaccharide biosynthesis protein